MQDPEVVKRPSTILLDNLWLNANIEFKRKRLGEQVKVCYAKADWQIPDKNETPKRPVHHVKKRRPTTSLRIPMKANNSAVKIPIAVESYSGGDNICFITAALESLYSVYCFLLDNGINWLSEAACLKVSGTFATMTITGFKTRYNRTNGTDSASLQKGINASISDAITMMAPIYGKGNPGNPIKVKTFSL